MQRKLIAALVGLGLAVSCVACTPDPPSPTPSPTAEEDMSFQALHDLPDLPPTLAVNGASVTPYMVDWRTGEPKQMAPADSINGVPRLTPQADTPLEAVLSNTAEPSGLTVGVYAGGLDSVDPTVPPEISYDCLSGPPCSVALASGAAAIPLDPLFPDNASASVFVVTATYFAESEGTPFANTVVWVFEASR